MNIYHNRSHAAEENVVSKYEKYVYCKIIFSSTSTSFLDLF